VTPIRDEEATIATIVEVLTTDRPLATSILLVDAGSTDGTVQIARGLARIHDLVDVIEVGPVWPGRARNIGVAASSTRWVLLLDAGVDSLMLESTWVPTLSGRSSRHGTGSRTPA
jgi:glycosyltransferase involved in cell wall biosynthesis